MAGALPCWNCAEPSATMRCKGCKTALYCGKDCQKAHWSQGDHMHACAVLGDPYHPTNLTATNEDHARLLIAMERGLVEAAADSLVEDDFVALGNKIADGLALGQSSNLQETRYQARAWLEAHELGPNIEAALPTEAHVRVRLIGEIAHMQKLMAKIGRSEDGTLAALEQVHEVCKYAEALAMVPQGQLDLGQVYDLIEANGNKKKAAKRKKKKSPAKKKASGGKKKASGGSKKAHPMHKATTKPAVHHTGPRKETHTQHSTVTHGSQTTHAGHTTTTHKTTHSGTTTTHRQTPTRPAPHPPHAARSPQPAAPRA